MNLFSVARQYLQANKPLPGWLTSSKDWQIASKARDFWARLLPRINSRRCLLKKPETTTAALLKEYFLNRSESFWGIKYKQFPNGRSWTNCTGFAWSVQDKLGKDRVKVWGYFNRDNPEALAGAEVGGHDFALLDERFVIDPWLTDVWAAEEGVFDLQGGEEEQVKIRRWYGDRQRWSEVTLEP